MILYQKINLSTGQVDFFSGCPPEIWLSLTTGQPLSRALDLNAPRIYLEQFRFQVYDKFNI